MRYMRRKGGPATVEEIVQGVTQDVGPVARSSVRSYLQIGVSGDRIERLERGRYRLKT